MTWHSVYKLSRWHFDEVGWSECAHLDIYYSPLSIDLENSGNKYTVIIARYTVILWYTIYLYHLCFASINFTLFAYFTYFFNIKTIAFYSMTWPLMVEILRYNISAIDWFSRWSKSPWNWPKYVARRKFYWYQCHTDMGDHRVQCEYTCGIYAFAW